MSTRTRSESIGASSHPVFLVHGSPGDGIVWSPLLPHVPGAIALELPDHGADDEPEATVDDHIAHVVQAVERSPQPVVLLGHSYGAWVAAHVAARASTRVARLILVAGFAAISADTRDSLRGLADALDVGALNAASAVAVAAQRWLGPAPHNPSHVDAIRALFTRAGEARLARQLRRSASATKRVDGTQVPTDVIAIDDDAAVPRAASQDLSVAVATPLTVWPGGNHFAHWVDPAGFARRLAL